VIDRSWIVITALPLELKPVSITSGRGRFALGQLELAIDEQKIAEPDRDPMIACLDKEKVSFPLNWRTWKEGDYFFPFGMKGRKKVSDFLIDLKLSIPDKQSVTVIESEQGIICLPGFRIDDRFKVTSNTRNTLVLKLKRQQTKMPPVTEAF
jgi:tRNA(Ile)-lysidine synthase